MDRAAVICARLLKRTPDDISLMNMLGVIAAREGRFSDAAEHFQGVAQKAPNDPGVISNLAQAQLECGAHDEATANFQRVVPDGNTLRILRNSEFGGEGTKPDQTAIHTVENVILDTGYWAIIDDDRLYARDVSNLNMMNSPTIKGRITADLEFAAVAVPTVARNIDTPCVFLGSDENYAHWLYRYLMRLAALENRPDLAGLPLLAGESKPYQTDALALTGFGDNEIITAPRNSAVLCQEIHVPVCLWSTLSQAKLGIDWLRNRVFANLGQPGATSRKRVFVSRRDAPSRYMSNENEVIDALKPFGFEAVELSALNFAEQVSLFAGCEFVVAPHGAGLANLIFAPSDCRVVELVSDPIAHMNDFRQIRDARGQRGTVVPCASFRIDPGANKPMVQHTFQTEPAKIVSAVEVLLKMES